MRGAWICNIFHVIIINLKAQWIASGITIIGFTLELYYYSYNNNAWNHNRNPYCENVRLTDYGARPFVLNINQATKQNTLTAPLSGQEKLTSNFNEY